MKTLTHYVGGTHRQGTSGRFADVYNPSTGQVQAQVPLASADEVCEVIANAAEAQAAWAATNPQKRARILHRFGDLNQHGPDAFRFYTKTKTVTSRWPSGIKEGASFTMPSGT